MNGSLHFRAPGIDQYLDQRPMNLAGAFMEGYRGGVSRRALDIREAENEAGKEERGQAKTEAAQMRYGPDLVVNPDTGQVDFGASEAAARMRMQQEAATLRDLEMQDYERRRQADLELAQERAILGEMFRPEPTPPTPREPARPFSGTRKRGGGEQRASFATQEELDAWMREGDGAAAADDFGASAWQAAQDAIAAAEREGVDVDLEIEPLTKLPKVTPRNWLTDLWGGISPAEATKRLNAMKGGATPIEQPNTNRVFPWRGGRVMFPK